MIIGVIALAGFARFNDLGGAPLAEDEYYTTKSIEWILATGLPTIPSGGYYVRALLFQYASAGFAQLFGAGAFAYRLTSALCGLLVGVLGFFYARRHGGFATGLAVAAALLLSSWAIEFGRLVRFYTLFQIMLLLFLFALDRAYFEARAGWRYLPHAALLVGALAHELAVLLTPLLFLPMLPNCTRLRLGKLRRWIGFALVSLLITLVVFALTVGVNVRDFGVADRYPDDYVRVARFAGPLAVPILPFFRLFSEPILHLATVWLAGALLVAAFLVAQRRGARRLELPDLLLALALLASLFHLFAAMALILVFATARYDLWRLSTQPKRRLASIGAILAVVIVWLAVAAIAPERLRGFWSTFFGWPDVYRSTLRPFARELPELGLALMAALVWFGVTHRHAPLPDLLNHPGALVLYWMLAMGLFTPHSSTSRYWFPVLPVLYTLIAVSLAEAMTRWLPRAEVAARYGASLVFFLLFALSPDFQPRHILNVEDDAVRYRTGEFARFASVWYPRLDVATAAETLEDRHADAVGARIVIEELPGFSYYLDAEHAVYFHRDFNGFAFYSREEGQLEMWSGQRLLSTPADLVAYAEPGEELWLVRSINPGSRHRIDLTALTASQLTEIERDVLGRDGAIELIRLRPLPPAKHQPRARLAPRLG